MPDIRDRKLSYQVSANNFTNQQNFQKTYSENQNYQLPNS